MRSDEARPTGNQDPLPHLSRSHTKIHQRRRKAWRAAAFRLPQKTVTRRRVSLDSPSREIGKILWIARWTGVMPLQPQVFRREAQCHGHRKLLEAIHLALEPLIRTGTERIRPADSGSHMANAKRAQPFH